MTSPCGGAAPKPRSRAKVALERVDLTLPGANAVVSGTLDVAGSGSSPAALVASLAGEGTARATGLSVPQADPAALPKVFADVEADTLPVDGESVLRALRDGSKGPLSLGERRFDLSLAGGVLHVAPRAAAGSRVRGRRRVARRRRRRRVGRDARPSRVASRRARQGNAAGAAAELDRGGPGDRLHPVRFDWGPAPLHRRQRPHRRGGDPCAWRARAPASKPTRPISASAPSSPTACNPRTAASRIA